MANIKNAAIREIIINRCLRHPGGRTVAQIMSACNKALDYHGYKLVTSENTIRADLLAISNRWHQVIDAKRIGRHIYYSYRDPDFSIFKHSLPEQYIIKVYGLLDKLSQYEGLPGFSWLDDTNEMLRSILHMEKKEEPLIAYDDNTQLKGMEHFGLLYDYVKSKQPILVEYRPYVNAELLKETIHPYFMKQYNSRWFLLGYNAKYKAITNFALDRIISIDKAPVKFIPNTKYDFNEYFDNIVGVTLPDDGTPIEEIIIEVDAAEYPYVSSKPMHPTQQLVDYAPSGNPIISLKVMPNFELKQLILSYGKRMTVLQPEHLRDEIKKELENILKNYQTK